MSLTPTYTVVNTAAVSQTTINALLLVADQAFVEWGAALAGNAAVSVRIEIDATVPSGRADGIWGGGITVATLGGFNLVDGAPAWELATGSNNNSSTADIVIRFHPDYLQNELYLDPTPATRGDTPVDKTDGLSVLLHEIGHALGFSGYYTEATNSFGGFKTAFDQRLRVVGGQTVFDGPNVRALLGRTAELTDFNYGHYGNSNEYPPFTTDPLVGLMNGVVYYRGFNYTIGDLDLAMMADMGLGTIRNDILDLPGRFAMRGGLGNDTVRGGDDINQLFGDEGNDLIYGKGGIDMLYGGDGNDLIDGGLGADNMFGGLGDDTFYVDNVADSITEQAGEGVDIVRSTVSFALADNVETLILSGTAATGTGNAGNNRITGNSRLNTLDGGAGNDSLYGGSNNDVLNGGDGDDLLSGDDNHDRLFGNAGVDQIIGGIGQDSLDGGDGNDVLRGGADKDTITGGLGLDWFSFDDGDFSGATAATADRITDFTAAQGDRIQFHLVDANANLAGDQAFSFIGTAAFSSVAGQLRYQVIAGQTYVQGDQNGDAVADFWVRVDGVHALVAGNFTL